MPTPVSLYQMAPVTAKSLAKLVWVPPVCPCKNPSTASPQRARPGPQRAQLQVTVDTGTYFGQPGLDLDLASKDTPSLDGDPSQPRAAVFCGLTEERSQSCPTSAM